MASMAAASREMATMAEKVEPEVMEVQRILAKGKPTMRFWTTTLTKEWILAGGSHKE